MLLFSSVKMGLHAEKAPLEVSTANSCNSLWDVFWSVRMCEL